jgi:hypothetical protein
MLIFCLSELWLSPITLVSSTNETDCHDITKILFKSGVSAVLHITLFLIFVKKMKGNNFHTPAPRRERGVYCFTSVLPSIQDIFRRIFLSNS